LEQVLDDFDGTVLLVTHDRYLIQALATGIWRIEAGELSSFDGDWEQFVLWRERQAAAAPRRESISSRQQTRDAQRENRRRRKQLEKVAGRQADVEEEISQKEKEAETLGENVGLAGERKDLEAVADLSQQLQQIEQQIAVLYAEWEHLGTSLEAASNTTQD
jgi:ATP-binding cassette subfamily F protein 3